MDEKVVKKLDTFFTKFTNHKFAKEDILIHADEQPPGIFYLKKGNVRQYVINKKGGEMTLNIYKPSSFFPMAWAVGAYPNIYYFEAINSIEVFVAPKEKVLNFIKKEPDVLFDLLKRVYTGLDGVLMRLEYLMSGNARQKLISILLISAKRFGKIGQEGMEMELPLTHHDLAVQAGVARETVTRVLTRLKKEGVISIRQKHILVKNIAQLEAELMKQEFVEK